MFPTNWKDHNCQLSVHLVPSIQLSTKNTLKRRVREGTCGQCLRSRGVWDRNDHKPCLRSALRQSWSCWGQKSRSGHVHTLIGTTAHFNLGWSKILVFQSCCDFANGFMFVVPHPQRICSSFVAVLVPFVHLFSPAWLTLWKPFCKICTLNDSDEYFVHIGFRGCIGPEKEVRFDAAAKRWWPSNLFLISSV